MIPLEFIVLAFVFTLTLGVFAQRNILLCAADDGDADMKIAPKSFSRAADDDRFSDADLQEYMRHKSSGNIDLARGLGERYAALLIEEARQNFEPWPEELAQSLRAHQRLLMFSYVVSHVTAELCPSSILAQTTLNVFYDQIEQKAPQLDKYIRDMASYSLYVLCDRSSACLDGEVGKIYARLCGDKDNQRLIGEGAHYYRVYSQACQQLMRQTDYAQA